MPILEKKKTSTHSSQLLLQEMIKRKQIKPKRSGIQEKINIRAEIIKIENKNNRVKSFYPTLALSKDQ